VLNSTSLATVGELTVCPRRARYIAIPTKTGEVGILEFVVRGFSAVECCHCFISYYIINTYQSHSNAYMKEKLTMNLTDKFIAECSSCKATLGWWDKEAPKCNWKSGDI
jgi:hypothetical protein